MYCNAALGGLWKRPRKARPRCLSYSWRSRRPCKVTQQSCTSASLDATSGEVLFRVRVLRWLLAWGLLYTLERARRRDETRRAMGSRSVGSVVAPALCAAVFLGLFLGQCSCQAVPQTVLLGGATGWTDTANANYTLFMSTVQFKAGDTLRFNNTDIKDHDVYQVETQADYDACNADNNTGRTVNAGAFYDMLFTDPAYRVWIIDTQYCSNGQKVEFAVLNADGTAVPPDTTADPPSLNAQQPDPESPPAPPDAPLALAGGPAPNAASSQATLHWAVLAVLVAACYLASPAVTQHRF